MTSVYQNNSRSLKQKRLKSPGGKQKISLQRPKQELTKNSSETKSIKEKILEIYNIEFEEHLPNILLISKEEFLKEISLRIEIIIKELFSKQEINEKSFEENLKESNKMIIEKYEINYSILLKAYNNYLNKPTFFSYLKHFRKHCIHTDDYAYHSCEYNNSKLIEIYNEKNKNEITHIMCSNCKKCYFPNQINLICNYCKINYYSCILSKNENPNILPATWEKYHCGNLINETMKCIKCKNILYLNLKENRLICLNKKCNFSSRPQSIIWNCAVCKKEFKSDAKIYNPLEMQMMKRSIKLALIFKKLVYPTELLCCKANPKELLFFHKEECKGQLYEGYYNNKEIIVCSKCHAMNFFEKFIWTCPLCKKRFRNVNNSYGKFLKKEDKYITMRSTESNSNFNNFINSYNSNDNPILRSSSGEARMLTSFNSTYLLNMRKTTGFNDNNKNHIVNLVTEIFPNSANKYIDNNNIHHRNNLSKHNKKQYSTLIEILAERNKTGKKNSSINKDNENEEINNDNIIIVNHNNENMYNGPNISDLRKITSNSTKDNSLSNKSNGNNSNPPTNKIKKITINKNENNNDEEEPILNINRIEKDYFSAEKSRKIMRKKIDRENEKSNDKNSTNNINNNISTNSSKNNINNINNNISNNSSKNNTNNINNNISNNSSKNNTNKINNNNISNNSSKNNTNNINNNISNNKNNNEIEPVENKNIEQIKIINSSFNAKRRKNQYDSNKTEEKPKIEKEKVSKKEKSQDIVKNHNKEVENENIIPKPNLLTIIPNKKRRKGLDYISEKEKTLKEMSPSKNNFQINNNKEEEEEFVTSPEQLNEVIKNGKIPSFKIENYVFKNPIGEGSFGKIYLIQKEKTHEKYALKKIICHDLTEIKQFQKEFELVYSKVHDNIMKIYNIEYKCLDSTTYSIYVLMELAISDWNTEIKRRQKKREYYTENEIVKILHQILNALIYLEENGIAHRDIKPQNILIYPNNIYKVADFGEAKNLSDSIQECTLRGSELYMSPVLYHCLKNRQRDVVHNAYKSDVFSLGFCLLYAMILTVQVINDIREIIDMNVISNIVKRALRRNYSSKMQVLVINMLELDENKRFSFKDIKKYLNDNFK